MVEAVEANPESEVFPIFFLQSYLDFGLCLHTRVPPSTSYLILWREGGREGVLRGPHGSTTLSVPL